MTLRIRNVPALFVLNFGTLRLPFRIRCHCFSRTSKSRTRIVYESYKASYTHRIRRRTRTIDGVMLTVVTSSTPYTIRKRSVHDSCTTLTLATKTVIPQTAQYSVYAACENFAYDVVYGTVFVAYKISYKKYAAYSQRKRCVFLG